VVRKKPLVPEGALELVKFIGGPLHGRLLEIRATGPMLSVAYAEYPPCRYHRNGNVAVFVGDMDERPQPEGETGGA